jgi:hypothetical protein
VDRRTRNVFVIGLLALVAASGVAAYLLSAEPRGPAATESASGVIVGVESEGLDRVRGFDLRTRDGTTVTFVLGDLENGATFPPGHLVEHQATGQPVRVSFVTDGATKVAIRIEDAP